MTLKNGMMMLIGCLLITGTVFADKVSEPPRKMELTGTVAWTYLTRSDGTKEVLGLILDTGKRKIQLMNARVPFGKDWRTNKKTWQWTAKDGKTIDFSTLVGKKVKVKAFVINNNLYSVISVETVKSDSDKPGAIVIPPHVTDPSATLPLIVAFLGALVLVGGGILGIYRISRTNQLRSNA